MTRWNDWEKQKENSSWKSITNCSFVVILLTGIIIPNLGNTTDLAECMTDMMTKVSGDTTISELRLKCEKQLQDGANPVKGKEQDVLSERLREEKEHVLLPFTLMSHKPNYILLGAYNAAGYNANVYREQFNDSSLQLDDTEAQFQISIKAPLAVDLFDTVDIYAAYTNRSFWQVYNSDASAPFRETNHEPELWAQFNPGWEFWGFKNSINAFGIVHQSNGRGGILSRSWNRIYGNFVVERGNFALSFKPWYRISEDADDDDNPDITDYLGHYELRAAYKYKEHVFSVMSRNNLESSFSKGAVEASWSFPLWGYPYIKGYIQYFGGYGESLIDYNNYVNRIGIGFSITDWL
jgi:phospholipase A1